MKTNMSMYRGDMYLYQPGHSEFGFVIPAVVGILQNISYAVGIGVKTRATKKYLTRTKRTQKITHKAQLELKKEEAEAKRKLLLMRGQTELYRDVRLKKLVFISIITVIAIVVLGLGTYVVFSMGSDNE